MRIAHFADVHIHNLERHDVYDIQFKKIYDKLTELEVDRILISGDLFENFVSITNEAKILAGEFLTKLSEIAKVVITVGNHDLMKKNSNRINSIKVIVKLQNNPNILYLEESGFFEDDEIVWVNYSHLDKNFNIDPWNNTDIIIPNVVDTKPTIGLFHDPVYGSKTFTGASFNSKKYKPITYFDKNDVVMLGDIHQLQYFRENKTAAYCSSTIQQNFGESPVEHGFILWDVKSKTDITSEYHDIPNEHNYINLYVTKGYNYDKIDLSDEHITPNSEIKIHWNEYSSNINYENEIKLREYVKSKYGIDGIKIEKNAIHTDINGLEIVNESIDILDDNKQRDVFIEFLKANEYDDEIIEEVLKIDDTVTERLQLTNNIKNVTWGIESFSLDNFKSYDKVDIKWDNINGIWQINGKNKQGKSTILDGLTYILYGKTISTIKKQKHGDNRYINNKRNLDYCEGSAILNIDDKQYLAVRRTERKWNRKKTALSGCSTTLEYYRGTEPIEGNKLTDEERKDTDKLIAATIGDMDDFVRLVLTTADNLNSLLSIDRADFIDSVTKDAGLDIFEIKGEEFKKVKKEETEDFINVNIEDKETEIETNKASILVKEDEAEALENEIEEITINKSNVQEKKELTIKTLHNIDKEIESINIENLNGKIELEQEGIDANLRTIEMLKPLQKEVDEYDGTKIDEKQTQINELKSGLVKYNDEINELKLSNSEMSNKIDSINSEMQTKKDTFKNELLLSKKDIEAEMKAVKKQFVDMVNIHVLNTKDLISKKIEEQNVFANKMNKLMADGKHLKADNDNLENGKVCPTCHRDLDENDIVKINKTISENKKKMGEIKEQYDIEKRQYGDIIKEIDLLRENNKKLSDKDYTVDETIYSEYNKTKTELSTLKKDLDSKDELLNDFDNNIPSDVQIELDILKNVIVDLKSKIDTNKTKIDNVDSNVEEENTKIENCEKELSLLKLEKSDIESKKEKLNTIPVIELNIEKAKNKISQYESQIEQRKKLDNKISENEQINIQINEIQSEIETLNEKLSNKNDEKSNIISNIAMLTDRISSIDAEIDQFREQKKREEILNIYGKCVHRDGLPSFLLKKSIGIINQELNNLLTLVDFTVYFDDNLMLKMSNDDRLDVSQNAIESSGMERTFIACALKIALRKVNNKSKPNLLIFDEITGKLDSESILLFTQLLEIIKKEVDKLIIIEHQNNINYDVLVDVKKNKEGISSLDIIY